MVLTRRQRKEQEQLGMDTNIEIHLPRQIEVDTFHDIDENAVFSREFKVRNKDDKEMYDCALILCSLKKSNDVKENLEQSISKITKKIIAALH